MHSKRTATPDQAQAASLATKLNRLSGPAGVGDELEFKSSETPRDSRVRGFVWWACYVLAWMAALSLCAIAALRIFHHDGWFPLIWLNAFTRYVYLPAYGCLGWAAWQRRWELAWASAMVVACHIVWMAPDFVRDRRFDSPATAAASDSQAGDLSVRIFFANVAANNREHDALLEEIAAADPDVIVLAEYSQPWHEKFRNSPMLATYWYGTGRLESRVGGVNVFSRVPLKNEIQNWVQGRMIHTIDVPRGDDTLRIIGLHAPRPIGSSQHDYVGYWSQMVPLLTVEQGPLVVVGDFNATEHSLVYEQLTAERLRSAHDDRGRGYATTWPNGQNWLPPIRIDQALLSPQVECEGIFEGRGVGSDHTPLVVDVRLRSGEADPR